MENRNKTENSFKPAQRIHTCRSKKKEQFDSGKFFFVTVWLVESGESVNKRKQNKINQMQLLSPVLVQLTLHLLSIAMYFYLKTA